MDSVAEVRRNVIRRVKFATNVLALEANFVPREGPFDAALTNGLLAIVSSEWPDTKGASGPGFLLPASKLLKVVQERGGLPCVDCETLYDGLELTQPFRHGKADDEFVVLVDRHVAALAALDSHRSLQFIETARHQTSLDECVVVAFRERAERELPDSPKDRLEHPDPDFCDVCQRQTFLRTGWDVFGGDDTEGVCVACGHALDSDLAYKNAVNRRLDRFMNDNS